MGRCRNLGRNVAKYHVKLSRKRTERIFKKKAKGMTTAGGVVDSGTIEKLSKGYGIEKETFAEEASEKMCIDEAQEGTSKRMPIVREGKLRRTELPLQFYDKQKGNERTDKVKPKAAKTSVVAVRQMSKKKARKILRAKRREQRQQERFASAMEQ